MIVSSHCGGRFPMQRGRKSGHTARHHAIPPHNPLQLPLKAALQEFTAAQTFHSPR